MRHAKRLRRDASVFRVVYVLGPGQWRSHRETKGRGRARSAPLHNVCLVSRDNLFISVDVFYPWHEISVVYLLQASLYLCAATSPSLPRMTVNARFTVQVVSIGTGSIVQGCGAIVRSSYSDSFQAPPTSL